MTLIILIVTFMAGKLSRRRFGFSAFVSYTLYLSSVLFLYINYIANTIIVAVVAIAWQTTVRCCQRIRGLLISLMCVLKLCILKKQASRYPGKVWWNHWLPNSAEAELQKEKNVQSHIVHSRTGIPYYVEIQSGNSPHAGFRRVGQNILCKEEVGFM